MRLIRDRTLLSSQRRPLASWQQVRRILLCRFVVRRHRSEIMFSVLVIILRPDHVAGLGLSLG
jgi:hypothetical protein